MNRAEMEAINPMITGNGNTFKVSSVLTALASLLEDDRTMDPDSAEAYGISVILATCAAALRRMGDTE